MLETKSEGIHEAVVTLKELTADEKIKLQCEAREMYDHTIASAKHSGRLEGKIEGRIEGKNEGKVEGKIEGKRERELEIACNMLKKGLPLSDICDITGLKESDIINATPMFDS